MRIIRTVCVVLAVAVFALTAMSCATGPARPLRNNVAVEKSAYLPPSEGVLVYGSAKIAASSVDFFGAPSVDNMEYIQLNPDCEPMIVTPGRSGSFFFTQPLPLGSNFKLFFFSSTQGRTTTFYNLGLQGKGGADFVLAKPGLLYLGSLRYCDKPFIEGNTNPFREPDYDTLNFYPVGDEKEIDVLKALLPFFKGTEWAPLIDARIKELEV